MVKRKKTAASNIPKVRPIRNNRQDRILDKRKISMKKFLLGLPVHDPANFTKVDYRNQILLRRRWTLKKYPMPDFDILKVDSDGETEDVNMDHPCNYWITNNIVKDNCEIQEAEKRAVFKATNVKKEEKLGVKTRNAVKREKNCDQLGCLLGFDEHDNRAEADDETS